jgi:hypothetical protein
VHVIDGSPRELAPFDRARDNLASLIVVSGPFSRSDRKRAGVTVSSA